jgi:hypothetical protein
MSRCRTSTDWTAFSEIPKRSEGSLWQRRATGFTLQAGKLFQICPSIVIVTIAIPRCCFGISEKDVIEATNAD